MDASAVPMLVPGVLLLGDGAVPPGMLRGCGGPGPVLFCWPIPARV